MTLKVESPFPSSAWPRVWEWIQDFRSRVADDFAPQDRNTYVLRQLEESQYDQTWAVYSDEQLCGQVSFRPLCPITGISHALFRKDFWGPQVTRPALTEIYRKIFESGVHKIVGMPFADNHALIALAKSLGAETEGVLRQHTKRGGEFVDIRVLGLFREDFEKACLNLQ